MSDYYNEKVSALIDGEHASKDVDIVDRLVKDDTLRDTWSRYHLIGDCLRGHLPDQISSDISPKISNSLENEPTVLSPSKNKRANLKPLAGFAIAASVAMVAVFSVQTGNDVTSSSPVPTIAAKNISQPINPASSQSFAFPETQILPAAVKKSTDTPTSVVNQRMNNYLLNHNEYSSTGSINGILPYVRIVTIESQE